MSAASRPSGASLAEADSALLGLAVVDTIMATRRLLGPVRAPEDESTGELDGRLAASFAAPDVVRSAGGVLPASLADFLA